MNQIDILKLFLPGRRGNRSLQLLAFFALMLTLAAACAGVNTPHAASPETASMEQASRQPPVREADDFMEIINRDWELTGVSINGNPSGFSRQELLAIGMEDAYTLRFSFEQSFPLVSGKAAPNRYRGAFDAGAGDRLVISELVSTRMASFLEPPNLSEWDYCQYLGWVARWDLLQGCLYLYAQTPAGSEIRLEYTEAQPEA